MSGLLGGVGLVALWVACGALAGAAPAEFPREDLAQVLGRTVCPLAVAVDEDPLRLPRRIKFLTCERAERRACGAVAACCRGARCVELFDSVLVRYLPAPGAEPARAARAVIQVPVGCACVLHPGTPALLDD